MKHKIRVKSQVDQVMSMLTTEKKYKPTSQRGTSNFTIHTNIQAINLTEQKKILNNRIVMTKQNKTLLIKNKREVTVVSFNIDTCIQKQLS